MPFYKMMQRLLTCASRGVYMTRGGYKKDKVIYRHNRSILCGTVIDNIIGYCYDFEPTNEDMFAEDWKEVSLDD